MRESRISERLGPLCFLPDFSMPASCVLSIGARVTGASLIAVPLRKVIT
jgi:hypothetical protein